MIMRCRVLILLILLVSPFTMTRSQLLRGRVTDESAMPLPAVSVYIDELRLGTTTNNDGHYQITLEPGSYTVTFRSLGYGTEVRHFTLDNRNIEADIILGEQLYEIPAVHVTATGEDPAYPIMRKVIGMAPYHLNQVKSYRAEVYIRGGGSIDKIPRYLKRRVMRETTGTMPEEGEYHFSESLNEITFNAPDRYLHRVISSGSDNRPAGGQVSPMDYIEASFYQPLLAEMAISPLAGRALSHYRYKLLGSSLQGDHVIDKIQVIPRTRSQQLFSGTIYIVDELWAIHSIDLVNDNLAGKIRVRQQYAPVEEGIWMPVSHEFNMDIAFMGVRAKGAYTSAVKYLELIPDNSLPRPAAYVAAAVEVSRHAGTTAADKSDQPATGERAMAEERAGRVTEGREKEVTEGKEKEVTEGKEKEVTEGREREAAVRSERARQQRIEDLIGKSDLTNREMTRLARLNEKSIRVSRGKIPLEREERTTLIIDEDAAVRESSYWDEVRPVPLTSEERRALSQQPARLTATETEGKGQAGKERGEKDETERGETDEGRKDEGRKDEDRIDQMGKDGSDEGMTTGSSRRQGEVSRGAGIISAIVTGRRWQLTDGMSLRYNGLADMRSLSYNTVDGFVAGSGVTLTTTLNNSRQLTIAPAAGYYFGRREVMWSFSSAFLYDPMHRGTLLLRAGGRSEQYPAAGVNQLVNTLSTLLFRQNIMKLYNSRYLIAGHTSELTNGLSLSLTGMYELRDPLQNSVTYSLFHRERAWTENLPDNPLVNGTVDGYGPELPVSHRHLSVTSSLAWTPRQQYRISRGAKINIGSRYPTITLSWKHGYNYSDTFRGSYELIRAGVNQTARVGLLNELSWLLRGGHFLNSGNMRLQDLYFFNARSLPLQIGYHDDAFYLRPFCSEATRTAFAEAHVKYTSPFIILKRIPPLSRTLVREGVSFAMMWSPETNLYCEAGYTLSELFLAGRAGIYAGFSNKGFESAAVRVTLQLGL